MTAKFDDYVIPDGANWSAPPCPGSVGSKPNLSNIQAQIEENQNAMRENRKARALAIPCPFCSDYHGEMQPPVGDLVGGEINDDFKEDVPSPVKTVVTDPDTIAAAIDASKYSVDEGQVENKSEDDEEDDNELSTLLGDTNSKKSDSKPVSKSAKSSSGSSSSSSSSR